MSDMPEQPVKRRGLKRYFDIHPPVFVPAALLVLFFIAVTLIVGEPMEAVFESMQGFIASNTGWFFVLVVNFFLLFIIYLAFSKYGTVRLGGQDAVPAFTRSAWFAMLFSAGMGIGILFWSVAEPVLHYIEPVSDSGDPKLVAQEAMKFSFLHWGLHAWGIYAMVALALAFFSFNKKQPLAIRSVFYPILGHRIHGPWGNVIEILAVIATVFGLATSLGFGVQQVNAGLNYLFDVRIAADIQVVLIVAITIIASFSVFAGLDAGVKRLSQLNIYLGGLLLLFVVLFGPTLFIFDTYIQNIGNYVGGFVSMSFWTEGYSESNWQDQWTVFYWAWWISWSPFVGMFIARVSRGRTIREFVAGVLVVPTILTFLWLTAFGGSAVLIEMGEPGGLSDLVQEDVAISLFSLLDHFPLSVLVNVLAMVLVISFFVTSSDSGSLVIDTFASGGKTDTPAFQRVFWAFAVGGVAAVLLFGGGLGALQTAAITTGLPFAVLLVVMTRSLFKGVRKEHYQLLELKREKEKESYRDLISDVMKQKNPDNHERDN